ncbi:ANTAR domain-containing protein [Amycolatopsis sp. NPDC051903]|uniref:ANTAR domain-containing protein n=1 Tax=Amycolatopsis sp. NPDC051903 TaxID=3363936 RepID=UPI0037B39EB3
MAQLEEALATQPVIEQAKGILMVLRNWSEDEAFAAPRQVSQRTNLKRHDVAEVVVAAGSGGSAAVPQATTAAVLAELNVSGIVPQEIPDER